MKDTFDMKGQSNVFKQIADAKHIPEEEVYSEMEKKQQILEWMLNKKIRTYKDVSDIIRLDHYNPTEVYEMARLGEDWQNDNQN